MAQPICLPNAQEPQILNHRAVCLVSSPLGNCLVHAGGPGKFFQWLDIAGRYHEVSCGVSGNRDCAPLAGPRRWFVLRLPRSSGCFTSCRRPSRSQGSSGRSRCSANPCSTPKSCLLSLVGTMNLRSALPLALAQFECRCLSVCSYQETRLYCEPNTTRYRR